MKIFFKTYGCQMNVHDSEVMKGLLVDAGHGIADKMEEADFVVINTCAVRGKSENKVYSLVGRLKKKGLKVGVTGCVAQFNHSAVIGRYDVDFVLGTRAIASIVDAVEGRIKEDLSDRLPEIDSKTPRRRAKGHHAWVNIIAGCDKFCTYCIVPYTRGREISRTADDILTEVRALAGRGYNQVTFLGQNVDSYGMDLGDGTSLAGLLDRASKIDGIRRFWFLTSYPTDMTDDLIKVVSENEKIAKSFHLPAQSGSDRILKKMNRRYTRKEYLDLIRKIRKEVEGAAIGGDIIVGFPGETEEDFEDTIALLKEARYARLNIAPYSPRPGTVASARYPDDVPASVKKERLARISEIQHVIEKEINEEMLGKTVEIIIEGHSKEASYGRTLDNRMVFVKDRLPEGTAVRVRVQRTTAGSLYGEPDGGVLKVAE